MQTAYMHIVYGCCVQTGIDDKLYKTRRTDCLLLQGVTCILAYKTITLFISM